MFDVANIPNSDSTKTHSEYLESCESRHWWPVMAATDESDRDRIRSRLRKIIEELIHEQNAAIHGHVETGIERVLRFLRSKGNEPQTATAIRKATGLSRGALSNLLYTDQKGLFHSETMPGRARMKVWSLREVEGPVVQDFAGKTSVEVCRQILLEHGNEPMHVLTLAKEALKRGYKGKAKTTGDALEFTTATGFWARLARDYKHMFEQVKDKTFRVRDEFATLSCDRGLFSEVEEEDKT